MNRAMRRAKPSKVITKDYTAAFRLINQVQPFENGEMTDQHLITRSAYERLCNGTGDVENFDRLGMVLNVGLVRAESIDQLLVETIERGQSAMIRMQERFKRGLSLGWDAEGLQVMPDALDVCEEISDKSSAMQLTDAIHEAFRRITDGEILGVRK